MHREGSEVWEAGELGGDWPQREDVSHGRKFGLCVKVNEQLLICFNRRKQRRVWEQVSVCG